jgi:glutathione S-transferase
MGTYTFLGVSTRSIPSNDASDTRHSYVLLACVSTFFVGTWHSIYVGSARKAAKIPYPYEYASYEQVQTAAPASAKAMIAFNSAQRSHQNFNENHPTALGAMLIAGLRFPTAIGIMGAVWAVNRVVYAIGYKNSGEQGGKGRYYGIAWQLTHYAMIIMAGVSAWGLATA